MADAETDRVALVFFSASDGTQCVGSGLLVNARAVLTADHVADGSGHRVECRGHTHKVTQVIRSGSSTVDLAILVLKEPIAHVTRLSYAQVDRGRASQIHNCVAVGFPRWKRDGDVRRSAQVNGTIPTGEGLEQTADRGLQEGFLTLVGNREPSVPPIHPGPVTEAGTASPWGGMSGAVVTCDSSVIGVVRSVNLASGTQSLTVTPLTAIENLADQEQRKKFWDALGVPDPGELPRLPAAEAEQQRPPTEGNQNDSYSDQLGRLRRTAWKLSGGALAAGGILGAEYSAHHHPVLPAPAADAAQHSTGAAAGGADSSWDEHPDDADVDDGFSSHGQSHHPDAHPTHDSSHADAGLSDSGG
jgi:hypothetical protein